MVGLVLYAPNPRGTSQPTMQIFFDECILQGAIDFAVMRMRSGVGAAEQMVGLERNAARSIYANLSKFNRKILPVEKIEKLLYILLFNSIMQASYLRGIVT